jgi:hypothetical protein
VLHSGQAYLVLGHLNQSHSGNVQGGSEFEEDAHSRLTLPALDQADECAVNVRCKCKLLLSEADFPPNSTQHPSKR